MRALPSLSRFLLPRLALAALVFLTTPVAAEPVTFETSDHVTVSASYLGTGDRTKPIILLFHQAASNGAEYAQIAPRLVRLGYNTLAVDQRAGGPAFGRTNVTVARLGYAAGYLDALPDLVGAVDWAKASGHTGKVIVWGSSYSASLVFLLAAQDARVSAVIAFSPGEYFSDTGLVHRAAAGVRQPVLVSQASDEGEIAEARSILASVASTAKTQLTPKQASHGSSALDGAGAVEIWPAVERFLASVR